MPSYLYRSTVWANMKICLLSAKLSLTNGVLGRNIRPTFFVVNFSNYVKTPRKYF